MKRYTYITTSSTKYWEVILNSIGREFTQDDHQIIKRTICEKDDNNKIKQIHELALKNNLCVVQLSSQDGNCLFDSLEKSGIGMNALELRQMISRIFYLFADLPNLIPTNPMTLRELFNNVNDIEYVFSNETNLLYRYNYDMFCLDLYEEGNWSRLPTELLLMVISYFMDIQIHIYHDNQHINLINLSDSNKVICVGLIDESHYIPINAINLINLIDPNIQNFPKYKYCLKEFHQWAREIADEAGLYCIE